MMDNIKYDMLGFDEEGYNKEGYDRMGYNREGYDKDGFDRNGFNKYGINKLTGYDKDGFDKEGFDINGYDHDGYNREGFDLNGYDREGYNKNGYNKIGFDRDGYNIEGYDDRGFNRNGFNKAGFDKEGYDIRGFNKSGYNREGLDRFGYDRYGYNKDGFDVDGFDREGYNKLGFNREGYDRNGYDRNGYDKEGYDKDGYDSYGYNGNGYDKDGYDIFGLNIDGYNLLGYKNGFDSQGNTIDGFNISMFDDEGYHLLTGYNIFGYDRDGFNVNGIDKEGYDKEGYSFLSGFNKDGYDREGYNKSGFDKNGYDRTGFNKEGYSREGYNKEGYDKDGYDKKGYDREGYNRKGYDSSGYDREGNLDPSIKQSKKNKNIDLHEDKLERQYAQMCIKQINGFFKDDIRKQVLSRHKPQEIKKIDKWGFVHYETKYPNEEIIDLEVKEQVDRVLNEPYFAHVNYADDSELYLGKTAVHGWVTDWSDERASLYYQYEIYIGDEDVGLNYVRDINFTYKTYQGYLDLFNKLGNNEIAEVADEHLLQIIRVNQNNKKVHDIIETIQRNQYEIISCDKDKSVLILGCAGSGKTMILMHKIRFMKYNNKTLEMKDVMVVSPTDILGRESRELSRLLQIGDVRQFTTVAFYEDIIKEYLSQQKIQCENFFIYSEDSVDPSHYNDKYLTDLYRRFKIHVGVPQIQEEYLDSETKEINKLKREFVSVLGDTDFVNRMFRLYEKSTEEIQKYDISDIERIILNIDKDASRKKQYERNVDFIDFMMLHIDFKSESNNSLENSSETPIEELTKWFYYTDKALDNIDYEEFKYVIKKCNPSFRGENKVLQIVQAFSSAQLEKEDAYRLISDWKKISKSDINRLKEYYSDRLIRMSELKKKKEILQNKLQKNVFPVKKYNHETSVNPETSMESLLQLYLGVEDKLKKYGYTPFEYFEIYTKIENRRKLLVSHKKGEKSYMFYMLLNDLGIKTDINNDISIPESKAMEMTFLLYKHFGPITENKKYLYIDEFQDFSPVELLLFKNIYPNAVINLYGDFNQCINMKGINNREELPSVLYDEEFAINENYRNARQIADYVKKTTHIDMVSVGLDGILQTVDSLPYLTLSDDDRVAIIVSDIDSIDVDKLPVKVNNYNETGEIIRGSYNLIPVCMTKGLEFEKVIAITKNMNVNEYYVSCTRAIKELYVINNDKYF